MSWALFRTTMKSNWILLLIFVLVMALYMSIIVWMYSGVTDVESMLKALPETLVKAMGFEQFTPGLTGFLAGYFYGFIVILFPMIYCIILGNGLIARHVDSGTMAYLLSTPISRVKLATTQAVYFLVSLVVLFALVAVTGIGVSAALFPGELDVGAFLLLNAGALLLFGAVSSICFFSSCLFSETRYSVGLGAGVPVFFFLVKMLSEVGGATDWLANLSLFSLYDVQGIVAGDSAALVGLLVYVIIAVVLYTGGVVVFDKKDLPI